MQRPNDRSDVTISRRAVLRGAAALGAASLGGPLLAHAAGSDRLRVGLVGCGGRGTGAAANALAADPGVVLWAMSDVLPDKLAASHANLSKRTRDRVDVPEERRFLGFDGYRKVLASGVDVVLLATHPQFRPVQLRAAVDAGVHVFCEKPVAVDAAGVRSVLESARIAQSKGLSLVSGFCWRYHRPNRETYREITGGRIGDVRTVQCTYLTGPLGRNPRQPGWTDMEFQLRNWWHFTWLSGDHIVEQACHSIDKINWAMDGRMPARCWGTGGRLMRSGPESGNSWDHFTVVYEWDDGARAYHVCRQMPHAASDNTEHVIGTKGHAFVNGWGPTMVIEGERPWAYEGPNTNMYQVEHDELFASIRSGEPINDGTPMANSTMLALMGRMACYRGQTISWEDALHDDESWAPGDCAMGPVGVQPIAMPGRGVIGPPAMG